VVKSVRERQFSTRGNFSWAKQKDGSWKISTPDGVVDDIRLIADLRRLASDGWTFRRRGKLIAFDKWFDFDPNTWDMDKTVIFFSEIIATPPVDELEVSEDDEVPSFDDSGSEKRLDIPHWECIDDEFKSLVKATLVRESDTLARLGADHVRMGVQHIPERMASHYVACMSALDYLGLLPTDPSPTKEESQRAMEVMIVNAVKEKAAHVVIIDPLVEMARKGMCRCPACVQRDKNDSQDKP